MTCDPGTLRKALEDSVCKAVSGKSVAVAFSGGLDSGVVAALVKKYAAEGTLYTVGTEDSYDVKEAGPSAEELGMRWVHIPIGEDDVRQCLRDMIAITGTTDPITLSFELPLFCVLKNCKETDVLSGQGADELFAGYSKYVGLDDVSLKERTAGDMRKLFDKTLPHESRMAESFGKRMHYPFLDGEVIRAAQGMEDKTAVPADPALRKKALREVSGMIGCNSFSLKEKKAAQYGSGTMAIMKKMSRDGAVSVAELIMSLAGSVV